MKRLQLIPLLILLVSIPAVHANIVVLDTQVKLSGGDTWNATVQAFRGKMNVTIDTTQGTLNFSIYQNDIIIISMEVGGLDQPLSAQIEVNGGELQLRAISTRNLIASTVSIQLIQPDEQVNGVVVASGIILFLALPFIYILGRNQGLKKL